MFIKFFIEHVLQYVYIQLAQVKLWMAKDILFSNYSADME